MDYGISGAIIIVLAYLISEQQKNGQKQLEALTDILNRMESRLSTMEETNRLVLQSIQDEKDQRASVMSAVDYCRATAKKRS